MDYYQAIMTKKLGLPKYNKDLISKLLNNMAVDKVDYTNFFRLLSNIKADPSIPDSELLKPLKAVLLDIGQERREAWTSWMKYYVQEVNISHNSLLKLLMHQFKFLIVFLLILFYDYSSKPFIIQIMSVV